MSAYLRYLRLLLNTPLLKIIIVSPNELDETNVVKFEVTRLAKNVAVWPDAIGFFIFITINYRLTSCWLMLIGKPPVTFKTLFSKVHIKLAVPVQDKGVQL